MCDFSHMTDRRFAQLRGHGLDGLWDIDKEQMADLLKYADITDESKSPGSRSQEGFGNARLCL